MNAGYLHKKMAQVSKRRKTSLHNVAQALGLYFDKLVIY